jgi:hypothetical protein
MHAYIHKQVQEDGSDLPDALFEEEEEGDSELDAFERMALENARKNANVSSSSRAQGSNFEDLD